MSVKFVGDVPQSTQRVITGLSLLDKNIGDSQGNRGFPLRALVELYGPKGVGKTTFSTDMIGTIAKTTGLDISYCDLEIQSRETLETILNNTGFDGKVNMISMQAKETPEKTITRFEDAMWAKNAGHGVFDAIGAYTSGASLNGKIDARNVGNNPFIFGNFVGRLLRAVATDEDKARVIFMLNHEHPTFGTKMAGRTTSGGEKKKYLSHVRMRLTFAYLGKSNINFDDGYLIKGQIDDNRYGFSGKGRIFYAFVMRGQGIHRGLTAMWECVALKIADVTADSIGPGTGIKLNGQSFGKVNEIIKRANDDPAFFEPFMERMRLQVGSNDPTEIEDVGEDAGDDDE